GSSPGKSSARISGSETALTKYHFAIPVTYNRLQTDPPRVEYIRALPIPTAQGESDMNMKQRIGIAAMVLSAVMSTADA
ncbi:hypothetical protein SB717_39035, partial [Priestia sp. SIMBA_032]|uniref:hypothetical protein n=1 Tax=Priestia sp. SIMBA_032 TaxID=3085775 RepID=UPI00397BE7F8